VIDLNKDCEQKPVNEFVAGSDRQRLHFL